MIIILALGFVLTSQITDRILEVKVRAATEEIDRARNTVSDIVGGEETRSLDSSLQLARNTLIDRTAELLAGLQHDHPATGPGQVRGGDQGVVPAADDGDVNHAREAHDRVRTAASRCARSVSISGRGSGASSSPSASVSRWSASAGFRASTGPWG